MNLKLNIPEALIFDLDDTLVSFACHCKPAWLETCKLFSLEIGLPEELIYQTISSVSAHFWSDPKRHQVGRLKLEKTRRKLVYQALSNLGKACKYLAYRLADHYSYLQESRIQLFPDSLEILEFFKNEAKKLILVTNGNAVLQRRKIIRFALESYFDLCLVEGELGFGKPDPRIFKLALDSFGLKPNQVWCIGDNLQWDIEGAKALGISTIWKNTHKDEADLAKALQTIKPDFIIDELHQLKKIFEQIKEKVYVKN